MHLKSKFRKTGLMASMLGLVVFSATAREGMWQPSKLKRQESDMQKLGLKIPVEQLYNEEGTGLNNAVVLFGKGCTGEIVSDRGLLFTNHHCAYGIVQSLSTPEKNYLADGFWAMSRQGELPCPGLTVSFVRKTIDVTEYILKNLPDNLDEEVRNKQIQSRIGELVRAYKNTEGLDAEIKPFYNGNQYWASLMETFTDVRLVGFPPNGIGKFGADTDNWMWPRMTGDFAVFRVYASAANQPAAYSAANVPYKPKASFPIHIGGYQEDEFTMVYGFPFQTQEYLSSYQLGQVKDIMDPVRVQSRDRRLSVWNEDMRKDPEVFLKYAAKQSSISNGWKKWQGEIQGLTANNVMGLKQKYEHDFQYAVAARSELPEDRLLLSQIQALVLGSNQALRSAEYTRETVLGIEAVQQAATLQKVLTLYRSRLSQPALEDTLQKIKASLAGFYKDYHVATDQKVFDTLIPYYMQQGSPVVAPGMKSLFYNAGQNFDSWSRSVYNNSYTVNSTKMNTLLDAANRADSVLIQEDPAYKIYHAVHIYQEKEITPVLKQFYEKMTPLNRIYMKRQMEYNIKGQEFYPDANQTLRLSYGKIERVRLPDSDIYQTTLDDLIPRHDASIEEFNIPQGLRNLYLGKNYGRWAVNGTVPVNFIASNHTSGGNSGSPVLNAKGALIGINFDRIWQGTMSDLYYDPAVCRNVTVDIRYVLFIIEKYGNAGWLLQEMKLVK